MLEIFVERTCMVPVTFTLGSSRQSTVALDGGSGYRLVRTYLERCDKQLGYARYRARLR